MKALALRPGSSAPTRMPSTARSAPRGGRRGLLVLTAGPMVFFYRRYSTVSVASSLPDEPFRDSPHLPLRALHR
jgi:hypothetical protein